MKKRQKNSFLTPLVVEVMPGGKRFKLHHEFTYLWKREYIEIHVSSGFVTDFASIPRICRLIIPKLGKYTKAAVIHDAIYQDDAFRVNDVRGRFTRADADLVFRDGMRDLGVVKWKRIAMWLAVRLFGWASWRKR